MTRFPILAALEAGAPTDLIADSLSQGDRWAISDAQDAAAMLSVTLRNPVGGITRRLAALWLGGAS